MKSFFGKISHTEMIGYCCVILGIIIGLTVGSTIQQYIDRKEAIISGVGCYYKYNNSNEEFFMYNSSKQPETIQGFINCHEKNN